MPQPLSPIDAISPAFQRLNEMLFQRFRIATWIKIGFIGWLAGGTGYQSLNLNTSTPRLPPGLGRSGDTLKDLERALVTIQDWMMGHLAIIVAIVAVAMLLSLLFAYISCRFRFILLDTVLAGTSNIGRGWRQYSRQANEFFCFWVILTLASWGGLYFMVIAPLWRALKSGVLSQGDPLSAIFAVFGSMFLALMLFGLVFAIAATLAYDFVVPMMALENHSVTTAWLRLKDMIAAEPGAFAGYMGMKLVLHIGAGIAITIAFLVGFLILLIPGAIIAIVGIFGVAALKSAGGIGIVLGSVLVVLLALVGAALVGAALVMLLGMMTSAPSAVFFTSYSLYFMGGRLPRLGAILWPALPPTFTPPTLTPPPFTPPQPPPLTS